MNKQIESQVTCNDVLYQNVYSNHSITVVKHEEYVKNFKDPALSPNTGLASLISAIIGDPARNCIEFLHFGADPFNTLNNDDITLINTPSPLFIVNYSVALFRKILAQHPGVEFHFNKAKKDDGFDIIFKAVNAAGTPVYWGNVSSGIPLFGEFKNLP